MSVTIHLSWPANPAAEQIQKYEVHQSKDGGAYSIVGNPTVNSFDVLNPLPGVYTFKVRAVNLAGTGPFSNVSPSNGAIPSQPGDITVEVVYS